MKNGALILLTILISLSSALAEGDISYDKVVRFALFSEKNKENGSTYVRVFGKHSTPNSNTQAIEIVLYDQFNSPHKLDVVELEKPFISGKKEFYWYFDLPIDFKKFGGGVLTHNQIKGSLEMTFIALRLGNSPSPYELNESNQSGDEKKE